jgi:hypothetical protein
MILLERYDASDSKLANVATSIDDLQAPALTSRNAEKSCELEVGHLNKLGALN